MHLCVTPSPQTPPPASPSPAQASPSHRRTDQPRASPRAARRARRRPPRRPRVRRCRAPPRQIVGAAVKKLSVDDCQEGRRMRTHASAWPRKRATLEDVGEAMEGKARRRITLSRGEQVSVMESGLECVVGRFERRRKPRCALDLRHGACSEEQDLSQPAHKRPASAQSLCLSTIDRTLALQPLLDPPRDHRAHPTRAAC